MCIPYDLASLSLKPYMCALRIMYRDLLIQHCLEYQTT